LYGNPFFKEGISILSIYLLSYNLFLLSDLLDFQTKNPFHENITSRLELYYNISEFSKLYELSALKQLSMRISTIDKLRVQQSTIDLKQVKALTKILW